MEWHIITGEYPPKWGGVSDYTYRVSQEFTRIGDQVHVWAPASQEETAQPETANVHALPSGFGWRWLRALDRQLRCFDKPRNILIQYVPHMYGWKSMNLAFCFWICLQRKHNVLVMFHEVAFPFRRGQRIRHALLASIHRFMAWTILHSVKHSFTSTEPYIALLQRLGNPRTPISLLRICSNLPDSDREIPSVRDAHAATGLFTVGIFSNFAADLRSVLEPVIGCVLKNPKIEVLLLGPGESFRQSLAGKYPNAAGRIRSTGRLRVDQIGEHMRRSDALLQLYPDGASAARGTLVGAMASGVPVVTTSGPATDQLLLRSQAMLFPRQSPESIRDAIELLLENPVLAREIAGRAQQLYRESFQPAVIVSRIRDAVYGSEGGSKELAREEPALQD